MWTQSTSVTDRQTDRQTDRITKTVTLRSDLVEFHQTAANLGLHLSWQKTKVQNLGSGDPAGCRRHNGQWLLATPLKQSQNFGTWDISNHLPVDTIQTCIDGLDWPHPPRTRCSDAGDNRDSVWAPSCDFIKPRFFRPCFTVLMDPAGRRYTQVTVRPYRDGNSQSWVIASDPLTDDDEISAHCAVACNILLLVDIKKPLTHSISPIIIAGGFILIHDFFALKTERVVRYYHAAPRPSPMRMMK